MAAPDKIIQSISDVAEPVRRRQYLVPVVVLKPVEERTWGKNGWFKKFEEVPILGPPHSDPEISWAAAEQHYHVDWRFVDPALRRELREWKGSDTEKGVVVWAADVIRTELRELVYRAPAVDFNGRAGVSLRGMLEPLHLEAVLPASRRCPHRGADLTHCKPDADGVITCPMHGLRWHQGTGKLVPASEAGKLIAELKSGSPTLEKEETF